MMPTETTRDAMSIERDKAMAQEVVAQFIGDGQGVPPGVLPLTLRDAIATALATARAEGERAAWEKAIETVGPSAYDSTMNCHCLAALERAAEEDRHGK